MFHACGVGMARVPCVGSHVFFLESSVCVCVCVLRTMRWVIEAKVEPSWIAACVIWHRDQGVLLGDCFSEFSDFSPELKFFFD